jgi:hypothetical protein
VRIVLLLLAGFATLPLHAATAKAIHKSEPARAAAKQPMVTLDVQNEESRVILESLRKQCGIRNLVVDPQVQARGTFFFRNVPCTDAFHAVLESLSLSATGYDGAIVSVGKAR